MTAPEIVMLGVVLLIGVPSAWQNPTAAALVIAWVMGQAIYLVTGDNLPVHGYVMADIFVIAVIFAKCERSLADRFVLMIFGACWLIYTAPIHDYHRWWLLWICTVTQFLAVGLEAILNFRRGAEHAASDTPDNPGALLVAYKAGSYG